VTRLLLALAALTGLAASASAQPPTRFAAGGVEVFAGLLHYHGLKPAANAEEFTAAPPAGRVLVIISGGLSWRPRFDALARETLAGGGSVMWATDGAVDFAGVLNDRTRLQTHPGVAPSASAEDCLNGDKRYPFLVPRLPTPEDQLLVAANVKAPDPAAGLLAGLTRVAAEATAQLSVSRGGAYAWARLADLPPVGAAPATPNRSGTRWPLAAVVSAGTGARTHRALVVANSSVVRNQLMAAEGTDNLEFANNAVVWLSAGGSRKTCLLVANGREVTRFDGVSFQEMPPVPPLPPLPPLPNFLDPAVQAKLTALANETLGKLEANNAFNRLATGDLDKPGRLKEVLRTAAVILGALALALTLRRLLGAKHAPDHVPVARDPARPGGTDSAARQREEVLQRGEYLGLVAEYLRGWFAERGGAAAAALPEIRVRPGVPDKPLRDALRILWGVAADAPAGRGGRRAVPYSRWKQLEPMIHAVQAAHGAGDWRFAEPKEAA